MHLVPPYATSLDDCGFNACLPACLPADGVQPDSQLDQDLLQALRYRRRISRSRVRLYGQQGSLAQRFRFATVTQETPENHAVRCCLG